MRPRNSLASEPIFFSQMAIAMCYHAVELHETLWRNCDESLTRVRWLAARK